MKVPRKHDCECVLDIVPFEEAGYTLFGFAIITSFPNPAWTEGGIP